MEETEPKEHLFEGVRLLPAKSLTDVSPIMLVAVLASGEIHLQPLERLRGDLTPFYSNDTGKSEEGKPVSQSRKSMRMWPGSWFSTIPSKVGM